MVDEGTFSSSIYETSKTLPSIRKELFKKGILHVNVPHEHRYKNLNKILANRIQQYLKDIVYNNHMVYSRNACSA